MVFESFQLEGIQRPNKIRFASTIAKYGGHLKGFVAVPKGQTTFFTLTINFCQGFREELEILTFFTPINNYCRSFKRQLYTLISFTPTNNYCRSFRKGLEIQLVSTTFILFVSSFDILNIIPSTIKPTKTSDGFWYRYYWRFKIKDLILATCSIYKYIWEEILCIILCNVINELSTI